MKNSIDIHIELDNAGLHNDDGTLDRFAVKEILNRITRVLTETSSHIADKHIRYTVSDINGNRCGKADLIFKKEEVTNEV